MLKISRLADYGMVLMHVLIQHKMATLSAKQLSELSRVPLPTVSKLLKLLADAGLVDSLRGVQGGYRLNRAPDVISVAEVINAIDGGLALTDCLLADSTCSLIGHCGLRGQWHYINEQVSQLLSKISLTQMQQPVQAVVVNHGG